MQCLDIVFIINIGYVCCADEINACKVLFVNPCTQWYTLCVPNKVLAHAHTYYTSARGLRRGHRGVIVISICRLAWLCMLFMGEATQRHTASGNPQMFGAR